MAHNRPTLNWYLLLAPRSVPSFSQVTMGLGFPKAVQVMVTLPPSWASMYWGGVSVKVGGAARDPRHGGGAGAGWSAGHPAHGTLFQARPTSPGHSWRQEVSRREALPTCLAEGRSGTQESG